MAPHVLLGHADLETQVALDTPLVQKANDHCKEKVAWRNTLPSAQEVGKNFLDSEKGKQQTLNDIKR